MTGRAQFMNDRQRVEALFFPLLFKSILESAAAPDECFSVCLIALDAAMVDILGCEDDRRRAQLMRRVVRLHDAAFEPGRKGGIRVDKIALEAFFLLQAVLASGHLELFDGSALANAIGAILDAFSEAFSEIRLEASARKQAAKALTLLQHNGLFDGVTIGAAA